MLKTVMAEKALEERAVGHRLVGFYILHPGKGQDNVESSLAMKANDLFFFSERLVWPKSCWGAALCFTGADREEGDQKTEM